MEAGVILIRRFVLPYFLFYRKRAVTKSGYFTILVKVS